MSNYTLNTTTKILHRIENNTEAFLEDGAEFLAPIKIRYKGMEVLIPLTTPEINEAVQEFLISVIAAMENEL